VRCILLAAEDDYVAVCVRMSAKQPGSRGATALPWKTLHKTALIANCLVGTVCDVDIRGGTDRLRQKSGGVNSVDCRMAHVNEGGALEPL
jgi:hypothetical protein